MSMLEGFLGDVAEGVARETHRPLADVRLEIPNWRVALGAYNSLDQLSKFFNTPEFVMSGAIDPTAKRVMREELLKRSRPGTPTGNNALRASRMDSLRSPISASDSIASTGAVLKTPALSRDFRSASFGTRSMGAQPLKAAEAPTPKTQPLEALTTSAKHIRSFTSGDYRPAGGSPSRPEPVKEQPKAAPASSDPVCEVIERLFQLAQQKNTSEVKLNGRPLQRSHVKLISKLLRQYPVITSLELRSASLDDTSLAVLSKFLRKYRFCSLTALDVSENRFKSTSLDSLCTALQDNFSIVSLKIPDQAMGAPLAADTLHAFTTESATQAITQRINFVLWANKQYQLVRTNSHAYNIMQIQNRSLTSFPEEVLTFESLAILEVSRCELITLPASISALSNLTKLNLSSNALDGIPGSIGCLTKLEELILSSNQISVVPASVILLVKLKELHLSNNRITELPKALGSMAELKVLQCGKNPFRKDMVVPKNIVNKGDEAILTYLQALHGVGDGSLDTVKLAFVGPTGVGKTSLIQALRKQDKEKDSKSKGGLKVVLPTTEGIEVNQFLSDDGSLTFNAWDFGSGSQYQPTHTFFLTTNTLYIMVTNPMEEGWALKLEYWLSLINARAGKAPVMVVATRLDEATKEQLKAFIEQSEALKTVHKSVCSVACISSFTMKGIKELHKEIIRVLNTQDWSRKTVSRSYRLMHYRLSAMKETGKYPFISYTVLQAIAGEFNVPKNEIPTLTDVLTTIGTIAYCPWIKSANTQMALLDPQWLTNAFSLILQAKNTVARDGVISSADLQQVWSAYPPEIQPFLISLFRQYELLYLLPDGSLLVPLTLQPQRPSAAEVERARAEFEGKPEASRVFTLTFMPPGMMGRALIRFLTKSWRCHLMWVDGFLVSQNEACAFFEYDSHETMVRITVVATNINPVLTAAIEEIMLLLREYPRLKYVEQLPCPYCNTHRFGVDELKDLASIGQMAQCTSTRTAVPIQQLLPGIEVAPSRNPGPGSLGKASLGAQSPAAKQSAAESLALRQLENVILEHHRLSFSQTLAERMLNETDAKRDEISQGLIDISNQGAQLANRVNDLHNSITTKAIAQQISGLDLKEAVLRSVSALQTASGAVRDEIVLIEEQLQDSKGLDSALKATARRPGSANNSATPRKSKKFDASVATPQITSLETVLQKMESVVSAHSVLQAHNTRLAEKRAQYETGLKALREQVASLEAVQADMVKESQQITVDLERMKTIQASLKTLESLARKGELVEAKGSISPFATAALASLDSTASDLKLKFGELGYLPAALPPDTELDFPDLKLQKQDNSEHPTPRAGTVPRLVERLTWARHPDFSYQASFMLTYRSFLAPLELLQCLVLRYCATPSPGADAVAVQEQQVPIRLRVLSVLRYWVDNFYDDFKAATGLLETLVQFLDNVVALSGNKQFVTQIKAALDKKREGAERLRVIAKNPPPPPILPDGWPMGGRWTMMDIEPVEVARQLSIIGLELLQNITPSELLGTAWTKSDKWVRSPNVMKSIAHFNKLSMYCLEDIVKRDDFNTRRNVLRRWIVIARECLRINNYSSVLALVAAMEHTCVHRLKKTWGAVGDDITSVYAELSPFTGSNYSKLKELVRSGPRPCLPYLGLYLTDLVFQEELPDKTEEGLINFAKNRKVAGVIQQLAQYQDQTYNFTPVPEIRELFTNYEEKDEDVLMQLSYKSEPKEPAKSLS